MNDDRLKYGTDFTSVKVHQSPGGNSSINLAWDEPPRRAAPQARGQSWDNHPQQERNPPRNQQRGYVEPRAAPRRGYQEQEPGNQDWREEPPRYEAEGPRRRGFEDPRYGNPDRPEGRPDAYGGRADPYEPRQDRYEGRSQFEGRNQGEGRNQYEGRGQYEARGQYEQQYRGEDAMPQPRQRIDRPKDGQGYGRNEPQDYDQRPPRPQYNQERGQPSEKNVHTSVKVREPPGGRTNFIFG